MNVTSTVRHDETVRKVVVTFKVDDGPEVERSRQRWAVVQSGTVVWQSVNGGAWDQNRLRFSGRRSVKAGRGLGGEVDWTAYSWDVGDLPAELVDAIEATKPS
ncbi:MAG: hypothetical protein ACRD0W_00885 [Acidimicrobiales bacterium]